MSELDKLEDKIHRLRRQEKNKYEPKQPSASAYAMRVGMDLVSGVAVGFAFGYAVDHMLNSKPFGMLIGLILGLGAGVKLMMQTAARAARDANEGEDKNG